jgi:low temperature requirement protein LtrA
MKSLLRSRAGHGNNKVSYVELLFDLVFVFAVTQLSHSLIEHFSAQGAVQTLLLMLAVWWVWIFTAWVTNWLDPEQLPVRVGLMALMIAGLILSSAIPEAFEARGAVFAGAYVTMQVGRSLFFLWAVRGHQQMVRNFQRITVWLVASAMFWISGAFAHDNQRLLLWVCALAIEFAGPAMGFRVVGLGRSLTSDWDVAGEHLSERCALFIIIALGESILVTGATLSHIDVWNSGVIIAFVASLTGSLAMWWLYFDSSAEAGSHRISHSDDPGRMARLAYTYLHLFIVAGIIVIAVADEFVMAHPLGHSDAKTIATMIGGTALYLCGNALFKATIAGRLPRSHLVGVVLMIGLLPVATQLSPAALSGATTLLLIAIAAWDGRHNRWCVRVG